MIDIDPKDWHTKCTNNGAQPLAGTIQILENRQMNNLMLAMYVKMQNLIAREEGQDLVEYALVVALIALGAVAAMTLLSGEISTVFGDIKTALTNAV